MSRHVIQVPINKSSNGEELIVGQLVGGSWSVIYPPMVSDLLYIGQNCRVGVAWNSESIPKNKNIVGTKLCLYANSSLSISTGWIKFAEFGEGSSLPAGDPADATFSSITSGWNKFEFPVPTSIYSLILTVVWNSPYDYRGYTTFNSHRASTNKPYIEVTYDDIAPDKPSSLYPNGITLSTRDTIRFAWTHNSREELQQKGFELQYSTDGGTTWTTVSQTTANQFYDMPPNTLPLQGSVTWKVRTIDGNDEVSEYSTASFTLGIIPQKVPIAIAPIGQYIDENDPITFEWRFMGGSAGEYQTKFDLEYSTDNGYTWITVSQVSQNTYYQIPAKTLQTGNVLWRVRTYNNWDEVSPYSENKSFTIIGSPPIPLITNVTNSGKPTITWQSVEQQVYELQIIQSENVIFDTGSVYSINAREFKLPLYLKDGNYRARLRIYNQYNLPSPYAEKNFTIFTVKPEKPQIEIFSGEYTITIKGYNLSEIGMVFRDNIFIGQLENGIFIDSTAENNKEYQYFIRSVNNEDNFEDSDIKLAYCSFNGTTLALNSNPSDFIKLKYGLNSNPVKSGQFNVSVNLQNFDGREYPIVEFSEFSNKSKTFKFYIKAREDLIKLINMIKARELFILRDTDGTNIIGAITDISFDENVILGGYEIGFTIMQTGDLYD